MRLHLAQPALTRQVSDLEDELGVDLLKRTSHGAMLVLGLIALIGSVCIFAVPTGWLPF